LQDCKKLLLQQWLCSPLRNLTNDKADPSNTPCKKFQEVPHSARVFGTQHLDVVLVLGVRGAEQAPGVGVAGVPPHLRLQRQDRL